MQLSNMVALNDMKALESLKAFHGSTPFIP